MADRITFPDSPRQVPRFNNSESTTRYAPSMPRDMGQARDPGLSAYVRMRIREWVASGRQLLELANLAGVSQSAPSQILAGLGVGAKTAPGFARAFGFASAEDMIATAYRWHLDRTATPLTTAQIEARTAVVALGQLTEEQADAILAAFSNARTRDRAADYWIGLLLAEAAIDRAALAQHAAARAKMAAHRSIRRRAENARPEAPPPAATPAPTRRRA